MNLLNLIESANIGYDNLRALMQAVQNSQDAVLTVGGEPITLTYPEARFLFGKYRAYNKAGRQEEFIADLGDPIKFDLHMKQLRQLLNKQKAFRGSVPGERGVTGDVPQAQLDEIGDTPAGQAALTAVQNRAYDKMDAWSANPKSGYSSTPADVKKATRAGVSAGNRLHGFGPDKSAANTVMARDALRQQQSQSVAEGDAPKIGGWIYVSPRADGTEHYAKYRNLDTGQDETKTFATVEKLAKWVASTGTGFDWAGYASNPMLKDKLLSAYHQYDKKSTGLDEIAMNNPDRPTTETAGKINWERMIQDYMANKPYTEFEFGNQDRPLTIYRSQVYAILKDFGRMKPGQKVNLIVTTFGDKAGMVNYLDKLRSQGMMPKKVPPYIPPDAPKSSPGQLELPGLGSPRIKEAQAQKKKSEPTDLGRDTARSPKVQRAFQLARARQAAAGSDIEAFVKDELEKAEQAQAELEQLRGDNDRQDQQIQQLAAKVRQQDQQLDQIQPTPAPAPVRAEPPKAEPKKKEEPKKAAEPKKKVEPAPAKPAEPSQRTEPRAEPAPAPVDQPLPTQQPTTVQSEPYIELPPNVVQFPSTAQRKKKTGQKRRKKSADVMSLDPVAAATQGIGLGRAVGMNEDQQQLNVGDPVIIRGNVNFSGKTGEVVDFGRDRHFVIVDLYNFGKHAFHASNVEYNEYADREDYLDEDQVDEMQTKLDRFNINQPPPGGTNKQREAFLDARDRLFRQMANASPGEKEAIRLKIADLEGRAQAQGIRIREAGEFNRGGYNAIKNVSDWAEKMRVMRELQKDPNLMKDPDAQAAIKQRLSDLLDTGIKQGYVKEALSDKAMAVLRGLKQPAQSQTPAPVSPEKQAEIDQWAQDFQRNVAGPMGRQVVPASAPIDLNVPDTPKARRGRPSNAERAQRHQEFLDLRRRIDQLDQLIKMKEQIDKLFIKAQNVRGGIYPGLQADIEAEELYPVPQTDQDYEDLKAKYAKDLDALQKFLAMKKAVYREGQDRVSESTALVRLQQARQALAQQQQQGMAEGTDDDIWGPQGNFAGDTKVDVGGVSMKKIKVGDTVKYFGEKAQVVELNPANNYARITANGKTLNVRLSDLKQLGQGMTEGHADQQRKIFKRNGKPVGEVGIDRESSPGVGQWYMKHYASGTDNSGYDSYEEAVAELKHCLKQGVAEAQAAKTGIYQTDVMGAKAYHAKCMEPNCDWESKRFDKIKQAQASAEKHAKGHFKQGVAEAFGPLPKDNRQIRLGKYTVDIQRVGKDNNYIGFAWNDSKGKEHYEEAPVGDLGSYDDLIKRIKGEIQYQERRLKQGVAKGKDELDEINWKKGLATGAMALGAMGAMGSAQARVTPQADGSMSPSFAQQMQAVPSDSEARPSAVMPNQGLQTVDKVSVDTDKIIITHDGKEYKAQAVPTNFSMVPRGATKAKVTQAQLGYRGIGSYVVYLMPNGTALLLSGSPAMKESSIVQDVAKGLNEFAPGGGSGSGDYFRTLASAWYNGVYDAGNLQKGIKSQEDIERLLQRGIVCPDGKTRKFNIDYNSNFDGVVIFSDDYYEHGDLDGNDGRTGRPWGPYDHMEFAGDELDEGVAEGICSECGGPSFSDLILAEKQDACYHKVRSRYKVWPSAYASGALVQCRKKGAANWGKGGKKNK